MTRFPLPSTVRPPRSPRPGARCFCAAFALLAALFVTQTATGHARNENYVWLNVRERGLEGRFEIRFSDLRTQLGVPVGNDRETARRDLLDAADRVHAYLRERFRVHADGVALTLEFTGVDLFDSEGSLGWFAQYLYRVSDVAIPDQLLVTNTILFDSDRGHRSLLCMEFNEKTGEEFGGEFTALVFSPTRTEQVLDLTNIQGLLPLPAFLWQGARAMVGRVDRLLFIVALLLPTVVVREGGAWTPALGPVRPLATLITSFAAFSLAHGLTLGLAGLDVVGAPSPLVESTVVLSAGLLALNNVVRMLGAGLPLVIFFLGLFHGLALATDLGELPFRMMHLKRALLGFTIGVELGQALVVAAVFPLILLLRGRKFYLPVVLVGGSIVIILVATGSLAQVAVGR